MPFARCSTSRFSAILLVLLLVAPVVGCKSGSDCKKGVALIEAVPEPAPAGDLASKKKCRKASAALKSALNDLNELHYSKSELQIPLDDMRRKLGEAKTAYTHAATRRGKDMQRDYVKALTRHAAAMSAGETFENACK